MNPARSQLALRKTTLRLLNDFNSDGAPQLTATRALHLTAPRPTQMNEIFKQHLTSPRPTQLTAPEAQQMTVIWAH
jgi:hypothetical protein